jgi:hypothetical protein
LLCYEKLIEKSEVLFFFDNFWDRIFYDVYQYFNILFIIICFLQLIKKNGFFDKFYNQIENNFIYLQIAYINLTKFAKKGMFLTFEKNLQTNEKYLYFAIAID